MTLPRGTKLGVAQQDEAEREAELFCNSLPLGRDHTAPEKSLRRGAAGGGGDQMN